MQARVSSALPAHRPPALGVGDVLPAQHTHPVRRSVLALAKQQAFGPPWIRSALVGSSSCSQCTGSGVVQYAWVRTGPLRKEAKGKGSHQAVLPTRAPVERLRLVVALRVNPTALDCLTVNVVTRPSVPPMDPALEPLPLTHSDTGEFVPQVGPADVFRREVRSCSSRNGGAAVQTFWNVQRYQ